MKGFNLSNGSIQGTYKRAVYALWRIVELLARYLHECNGQPRSVKPVGIFNERPVTILSDILKNTGDRRNVFLFEGNAAVYNGFNFFFLLILKDNDIFS